MAGDNSAGLYILLLSYPSGVSIVVYTNIVTLNNILTEIASNAFIIKYDSIANFNNYYILCNIL